MEIINKTKSMGYWNNTMIVITSDNGPTPTANNGDGYGQTLPLRGRKGIFIFALLLYLLHRELFKQDQ